jgi:hypothetical protein
MNHPLEQPTTQKKGSINKCPSCGAQLGAFVSSCEACGHEFTDIDANRSITALVDRFEEIEREVDHKGIKGKNRLKAILEKKARVIRDFPVPNSREDLQQLMFFIQPKIVNSVQPDPNIEDWRVKFIEVLNRAKNAYRNDATALAEFDRIEKSLDSSVARSLQLKARRNPLFAVLLAGIVVVAGIGIVGSQMEAAKLRQCEETYAQGAQAEKARLEKIEAGVDQSYKGKQYTEALASSGKLTWQVENAACKVEANQQARTFWDSKRTQLAAMIQQSAGAAAGEVKAAAERQAVEATAAANRESAEKQAEIHKTAAIAQIAADKEKAIATEKKW